MEQKLIKPIDFRVIKKFIPRFLQYSPEPATGSYAKSAESSLNPYIVFL
jgi:hypothetical protein